MQCAHCAVFCAVNVLRFFFFSHSHPHSSDKVCPKLLLIWLQGHVNYNYLPHTFTWLVNGCSVLRSGSCWIFVLTFIWFPHQISDVHVCNCYHSRQPEAQYDWAACGLTSVYNWFITFSYILTCEKLSARVENMLVREFLNSMASIKVAPCEFPWNFLLNAQRSKTFYFSLPNKWNLYGFS